MILWRVSNYMDLKGVGGTKRGGRWHSMGRPMVYLSEHPALAFLETLVHFEIDSIDDLPDTYKLLKAEIQDPADFKEAKIDDNVLEDESASRQLGDAWLASNASLLLQVPSVLVPESANFLFNPSHPDAAKARIVANHDWPFDKRFLKTL